MFKYKVNHEAATHQILVRKDMDVQEFTDALSFAMGVPDT